MKILDWFRRKPEIAEANEMVSEFVPDPTPDGKRLYSGINARLRTDKALHGKTAVEACEIFNTMTIAQYIWGRDVSPEEVDYVHSGQFMKDLHGSKEK